MRIANYEIGSARPLMIIGGPCVIESRELCFEVAGTMKEIATRLGLPYVFKASFDKANRTSAQSFRGPGMEEGLQVLDAIRAELGIPVLTDVHEYTPVDEVASVVDVLQTPAFLVRQTDFIQRVARAGKPMNIKKGQFLAPWDMEHVVAKCREAGNTQVMLCERGVSFGYNNLVADMRSLVVMRATGCPIVFDATHSVQQPGGLGSSSGGQREHIPALARAACAVGVSGIFMEVHPQPDEALSDGPNSWPLSRADELLSILAEIDDVVKRSYLLEGVS